MDVTPRTTGAPAGPADDLDLSPRATATGRPRGGRRPWIWGAVLAGVLGLGAFVVFQFLSSATLYFCNADEVGVAANCQEGDRFRLQGVVDQGSVVERDGLLTFAVSYGGATYPVRYAGDPGGIFDEGIPVVVEGRLVGGTFEGDRVLVKHSEQYREENPGRVPGDAP